MIPDKNKQTSNAVTKVANWLVDRIMKLPGNLHVHRLARPQVRCVRRREFRFDHEHEIRPRLAAENYREHSERTDYIMSFAPRVHRLAAWKMFFVAGNDDEFMAARDGGNQGMPGISEPAWWDMFLGLRFKCKPFGGERVKPG
jgi:hypothetical protein